MPIIMDGALILRGLLAKANFKGGFWVDFRNDGYINLLNRYGTSTDSSKSYFYQNEGAISDIELSGLYESGGLLAKIIDAPAEEAFKKGFGLGIFDAALNNYWQRRLELLSWDEMALQAIKWARLFGGALMVFLVDDGRELYEPLGEGQIRELLLFECPLVLPDYNSLYGLAEARYGQGGFGKCQFYEIASRYGNFRVHESRCLLFKNGSLPEFSPHSWYQYWGIPEYLRIKNELQRVLTSHGYGVKLLERSVQPIYKMRDLAQVLGSEQGEENVLKRLQIIDTARGVLNSIAIDSEGEDYDFKSFNFNGVKDILESTCNMLSAVTNIPQTLLFGRSPAGQNATGKSDLENYYNYVQNIQKKMLKPNLKLLLDLIFKAGQKAGDLEEIPHYRLEFSPLWSLNEVEISKIEKEKAETALIKAKTAQLYQEMQVLQKGEIRKGLKEAEDFKVEELLSR